MTKLTLYWDGRTPIEVDQEEFAIIRMMLEEVGGVNPASTRESQSVVNNLVGQGYELRRARELVILARTQWQEEYR